MAMDECPSISETILECKPFASNSVAQMCLRSWKRISGRPTFLSRDSPVACLARPPCALVCLANQRVSISARYLARSLLRKAGFPLSQSALIDTEAVATPRPAGSTPHSREILFVYRSRARIGATRVAKRGTKEALLAASCRQRRTGEKP
jgi:hypothetical protein